MVLSAIRNPGSSLGVKNPSPQPPLCQNQESSPPQHFSFGTQKLRSQSPPSARLRPFLSWDRRVGVPSHFILWTQEPRPPDPLPSGALVPPPLFGYPRIPALTQVVLPAEVQLLFVGHPLQVHSCAGAGLPRVRGKTQVLTLSDRSKDHKQPRPY